MSRERARERCDEEKIFDGARLVILERQACALDLIAETLVKLLKTQNFSAASLAKIVAALEVKPPEVQIASFLKTRVGAPIKE